LVATVVRCTMAKLLPVMSWMAVLFQMVVEFLSPSHAI